MTLKKKVVIVLFLLLVSICIAQNESENETPVLISADLNEREPVEETVPETGDEENISTEIEEPPARKPGLWSRIVFIGRTVIYYIRYTIWWVLTRNYPAAARNTITKILALALWQKIILSIFLLVILLIIWNRYFRDTRSNNMRKAAYHHKQGEKHHHRGNQERADYHYQKAREYREKAQEQW